MQYTTSHIARIIGAETAIANDTAIEHLLLDSRKLHSPATTLFFAIKSQRRDGHQFIGELYKKGVRNFVVEEAINSSLYPGANLLLVDNTIVALQQIAADHRRQFDIPVIGISGSNGKTVVKEWLYQLLQENYVIVRSPKSYNSQIGVPLSVWQMNAQHTLAIFEAGISEQAEMIRLERIIKPTIGVLTNIGEAHSDGFNDEEHKFREKLVLFKGAQLIIGREIDFRGRKDIVEMLGDNIRLMTWGYTEQNDFFIKRIDRGTGSTEAAIGFNDKTLLITIPFTDDASIENAITCAAVMLQSGIDPAVIQARMAKLHQVNMRLELKKGINNCAIINDSYSADLSSLNIALNFLVNQSAGTKKTVILSDFLHSGLPEEELYEAIAISLKEHAVDHVIGIGEMISVYLPPALADAAISQEHFISTESFIQHYRFSKFRDETILVKGARIFEFEKIVPLLEQKVHQTILEINLNALAHNLKQYQQMLKPSTKVMAMVKAFAYGSGGAEIAGVLQLQKVDYLGVAYADEGVELRKAGITVPIMVMNPEETAFEAIVEHNLEPEIYSFGLLRSFGQFLKQEALQQYPVHIEIETGMNRLGFSVYEIDQLADELLATTSFRIQSCFSHLAGSEDQGQDSFTEQQFLQFSAAARQLEQKLGYGFLKHIANSAGAIRHPQLQMDMVRLGIGLYGVDSAGTGKLGLQPVATLRSTVAQLKKLKPGESVSYNRRGMVDRDSVIATIRIGYADGYPRRLGNGIGKIAVKGKLAPVIGTVCMDMIMVDVTDIPAVKEGDEVIVFGKELSIKQVADWAATIPYEIMTGVSQRVKRVYFEE